MATIVDTFKNELGETINVYESGAHYNVDRKHLVKAPEQYKITTENVGKFKEQLAEKKREAVARGAAKVLERSGEWVAPNAIDVVEAIAKAIMLKALDPTNAKQVDAGRYIMQEMGLAESQTKSSEDAQQFAAGVGGLVRVVELLREAMGQAAASAPVGDVVDVDASDLPQIAVNSTDIRNE